LSTFFWTKTAPQYACEKFSTSKEDGVRFEAVFSARSQYTKSIHREVEEWVGANIARWKVEKPNWFKIELIPDDVLPRDVLEAEGGATRRRSNVSLREITGLAPSNNNEQQLALVHRNETSRTTRENKKIMEAWKKVAEVVYETRSNNCKRNIIHLRRLFSENEELMKPLLERCPNFILILCYILEDKFGFRVRKVDWTLKMTDWGEKESKRVGCR